MDVLLEPFSCATCGPLRTALVAGLITVAMTSLVGTWVVLRGMTFLGDALAHGVVPGVAIALLAGFNLTLGAALSALVMIAGVELVHRRARLGEDAGIGLLFVGMLALGVVIASKGSGDEHAGEELAEVLFGDITHLAGSDVAIAAVAAVVTLVVSVALYRVLLTVTFSERKAAALGLRPGLAHALLLGLVALAIVASFRAVGALLVFAFLVAPPATASLVARRVPTMMLAAIGFGATGVVVGLLVSFHAGTAASATMAGVTVALFFLVLVLRELWSGVDTRRQARTG